MKLAKLAARIKAQKGDTDLSQLSHGERWGYITGDITYGPAAGRMIDEHPELLLGTDADLLEALKRTLSPTRAVRAMVYLYALHDEAAWLEQKVKEAQNGSE